VGLVTEGGWAGTRRLERIARLKLLSSIPLILIVVLCRPSGGEAKIFRFSCLDSCYKAGAFIRCDDGRLGTCSFHLCPPPCPGSLACHPCNGGQALTVSVAGQRRVTMSVPMQGGVTYLLTCNAHVKPPKPDQFACPLVKVIRFAWKGTLRDGAGLSGNVLAHMTSERCDQYGYCRGDLTCTGPACPGPSGEFGLDAGGEVLSYTGEMGFPSLGRDGKTYCEVRGDVDWSGDLNVRANYECYGTKTHVTTTGTLELIRKWRASR